MMDEEGVREIVKDGMAQEVRALNGRIDVQAKRLSEHIENAEKGQHRAIVTWCPGGATREQATALQGVDSGR